MGDLGLASLGVEDRPTRVPSADNDTDQDDTDDESADTTALETALTVARRPLGDRATDRPAPSPGRLAQLRRRYHELGAANPYAVEEYAELKDAARPSLDTQGERPARGDRASTRG